MIGVRLRLLRETGLASLLLALGCAWSIGPARAQEEDALTAARHRLAGAIERAVNAQRRQAGEPPIDRRVIQAIAKVPRHEFTPPPLRPYAYLDRPLTVGPGPNATISQPSLIAVMTDLLAVQPGDRVLEVGVGGGYHTALLAELASDVRSVEYDPRVASTARRTLERLGYGRVQVHVADGYFGWRPDAPYDAILVRMAIPEVAQALVDQLGAGGRLVAPVGPADGVQVLTLFTKDAKGQVSVKGIMPVRFRALPGGVRT